MITVPYKRKFTIIILQIRNNSVKGTAQKERKKSSFPSFLGILATHGLVNGKCLTDRREGI